MKWEKPDETLVALFDKILPHDKRVERKKMFGYPCAFTNGNMFCGMHNKNIVARLPQEKRIILMKKNWQQFEPVPGKVMKEYLIIPDDVLSNMAKAKSILLEALEFAYSLPVKKKKAKK